MKPEAKFNGQIRTWLTTCLTICHCKLTRVENEVYAGFPDLTYALQNLRHKIGCFGFIESKYLDAWPKTADLIVNIHHFTASQKSFLYSRGLLVGRGCFMFLKIGLTNEYLLFRYDQVYQLETWNKAEMIKNCLYYSDGKPDIKTLVDLLTFK